jgi:hypothetical protein
MPTPTNNCDALQKALATGERRVTFGDKTVEYRSVAELQAAIREVEAEIARAAGNRRKSPDPGHHGKGF